VSLIPSLPYRPPFPPFPFNGGPGYNPRKIFQLRDARRWVLAHFGREIKRFQAPPFTPKTSIKFVEKCKMNGFHKAASYNVRFRWSQIKRGRKRINCQSCMLAVAYAITVTVCMINSYITILRCFVANKSTASRQRQCHDECMPKPTQWRAVRLSMISNMTSLTSVTLVQKMYVPPLLWTLVARVVKMDMQQWENCRIKCYSRTYAQTQSSHTIMQGRC
jgi:hypothetical protein